MNLIMNITAKTKICMIIGDPVEHSLSPQMHNAAYEALGINDEFVFIASRVHLKDIGKAVEAVKTLNIRGLTCTIPHKTLVMQYLDEIDPTARKIGAVNTIVNDNGVLKGYNTDWLGVVNPLKKITSLKNKTVALLGAGGAARAVLFGMKQQEANVTIFNRTIEKAEELAKEFDCNVFSLEEIEKIKNMDIIFNATSVGLNDIHASPVPKEVLNKHHIVFDAVYSPYETQLLREAKEKGATIIYGLEMLLYQGLAQFELYTGQKAPEEVMRKVLINNI